MNDINVLKITSKTNPDWPGTWEKSDVEDEIKDILGRSPMSEYEWIEWILGHDLGSELDAEIEEMFIYNDKVRKITVDLEDGDLTLEKIR